MEGNRVSSRMFALCLLVCSSFFEASSDKPTDRESSSVTSEPHRQPRATYVLRHEGSDVPCMLARMAIQITVGYLDVDDEKRSTYINIPSNATVSGMCEEPLWMNISWRDESGFKSLVFSSDASAPLHRQNEDDGGEISFDQVELQMVIDDLTFPGTIKSGEFLKASATGQNLLKNNNNKCKNVTVHMKSPMGPITVSFTNLQFQEDVSQLSDDNGCDDTKGIDPVAIGVGCLLGAIIISSLFSYAFCQWWRKRH